MNAQEMLIENIKEFVGNQEKISIKKHTTLQ